MSFHSEVEFVHWLRRRWPERASGLALGIGDDAAVVRTRRGHDLVLTTDLSVENTHFRLDLHRPQSIGHRVLARSLSDLAAMGATPRFALLSLAISGRTGRSWITGFYNGLAALARRFNVKLIGGDTTVSEDAPVVADLVALGEIEHGRALRRGGARTSDLIYVTGQLGMAALGLDLLRVASPPVRISARRYAGLEGHAVAAHLYPAPRCAIGSYLARHRLASAAIDVSDGFSSDLKRLCEASDCGARIWQHRLPVLESSAGRAPAATRPSRLSVDFSPLGAALHGGEDYELIFTVPRSKASRVPRSIGGVKLHQIGEISVGRSLRIIALDGHEAALDPCGYDHFRSKTPP